MQLLSDRPTEPTIERARQGLDDQEELGQQSGVSEHVSTHTGIALGTRINIYVAGLILARPACSKDIRGALKLFCELGQKGVLPGHSFCQSGRLDKNGQSRRRQRRKTNTATARSHTRTDLETDQPVTGREFFCVTSWIHK